VVLDLPVAMDRQAFQEVLAYLEHREVVVFPAQLELLARRVQSVHPDLREHLVQWVQQVSLVRSDPLAHREVLEPLEVLEVLEQLVQWVLQALLVQRAPPDHKALQDLLEFPELLEVPDLLVRLAERVRVVHQDHWEPLEVQVLWVQQESQVDLVQLVRLGLQGRQDPQAPQVPQELLDLLGYQGLVDKREQRDQVVQQEDLEFQGHQVHLE